MRFRLFFSIFALVLFSVACLAIDTVDEVKPQISVVFQEKVVILKYYLQNTDTGKLFPVSLVSQQSNNTFVFAPTKSLSNGNFKFTLFASDLIGNQNSYVYTFKVSVPGTKITLVEPNKIGVANSTKFRVGIYTSKTSVCKYTGISVSSYDDIRLKYFSITGNISKSNFTSDHKILNYAVQPDFPRHLYVVCKDNLGRENFANFLIYADTIAPRLTSVLFNPSPITEYPPQGNLSSLLTVVASEPVLCKYTQNSNTTYDKMTSFKGYKSDVFSAYKKETSQKVEFPGDVVKKTYKFYVQCVDRAGFRSKRFTRPISVDLTAGLKIHVTSPLAVSRNTSVVLNVTTNRRAYCVYKATYKTTKDPTSYTDSKANLSSSYSKLSTSHNKVLGTRSAGKHSLSIRCDVPEGVGLEPMTSEKSYVYVIDRTPPSKPVVNATTPICTNKLSAKFRANDTYSGIKEYKWAVGYSGKVLANGTTSDDKLTVSKHNNGTSFKLSSSTSYVFSVYAVDGAGNIGTAGTSNKITYDSTGLTCDKTPPVVTLVKSSTGDAVTVKCKDALSNCTSIGSYYGTSYKQPCNATQYFLEPVVIPLFKTTIVCWSIKDTAGNVNKGSQIVTLNASSLNLTNASAVCASGTDNDGDGYGENCLLGNDCDDTNASLSVGCANGCISDMDGDGYGIGCNAGNDCNGKKANLTTKCPNKCISDNDGDEYGLGCNNGPDCKGDDSSLTINCPNGCIDDNDGDSYGLGCPVGFDCHGENYSRMTSCTNLCIQDTDGDGYGVGCSLGLDCDGGDPYDAQNCTDGCTFDEDGDGYGFGCKKGLDCNGMNPLTFSGCSNSCVSDNDGDGYGWKCSNGADCNDTLPTVNIDCSQTTDCMYDHDGDGYGLGCELGSDCDDYGFNVTGTNCTTNCTYDVDCNALPDIWQKKYFNSTVCNTSTYCDADADPDNDTYTNIEEYRRGTDPLKKQDLNLTVEAPSATLDADADGMLDACEKMYGLDATDPYDAGKDADGDGLSNSYECKYTSGQCVNSLNPKSTDTDNDGHTDDKEIKAGTDPCDAKSFPSAGLLPLLMVIFGLLFNTGSVAYLIYKKYYIPLVSPPPKPTAAPAARRLVARPAGAPPPGVRRHVRPRRLPPRRPSGPRMSREQFEKEIQKRAQDREKILKAFGEKKEIKRKPRKVMEAIARKPVEVRRVRVTKPGAKPEQPGHPPRDDYISKLSHVVGRDYFDKVEGLSKKEADYFGKLATITKKKKVSLEDDHVSKLASITRDVGEDKEKKKELENAFKKSDMDDLDGFLTSRKRVDTFIKESVPEKAAAKPSAKDDSFDALSKITKGGKGVDALSELSKPKRANVMQELGELSSRKAKDAALSRMEQLSGIGSKQELFRAFRQMSKEKHIDKNVFEVLLSYLMKSGKITKRDVSEILFDLEKQGMLGKQDIAEVFFNLGIKK